MPINKSAGLWACQSYVIIKSEIDCVYTSTGTIKSRMVKNVKRNKITTETDKIPITDSTLKISSDLKFYCNILCYMLHIITYDNYRKLKILHRRFFHR